MFITHFPFTQPGEQTKNFAPLSDLEQLLQSPTHIPDRLEDKPNKTDLLLLLALSKYYLGWVPPTTILFLNFVLSLLHS